MAIMFKMKKAYFLFILIATVNGYAQPINPVTKIPFELEGNHIFIQLTINHSEQLDFVFDTGAGATVINSETAEKLNFTSNKTNTTIGAAGKNSIFNY